MPRPIRQQAHRATPAAVDVAFVQAFRSGLLVARQHDRSGIPRESIVDEFLEERTASKMHGVNNNFTHLER
ncbi:hypothetical protein [Xanthomonas phaseoli]|uniref:hypothetical protein n=1 Tax=Xanthomonas phaseoli TaxID=1985254 RepID=UPI0013760AB7|nr:hypothetical protein [Xanthomonas phaseoli]